MNENESNSEMLLWSGGDGQGKSGPANLAGGVYYMILGLLTSQSHCRNNGSGCWSLLVPVMADAHQLQGSQA